MTPADSAAVLDTPAIRATDSPVAAPVATLVAEEARDSVVRFLDVLLTGDRAAIERRFGTPSAYGTLVATLAADGWSVEDSAECLIETTRAAAHVAHRAFIHAAAARYDYVTLVSGVHAEDAPWHGIVHPIDLSVAVEATTSGHLPDTLIPRPGTLDGLLVCAAHALAAANTAGAFTTEFGWLDFVADALAAPAT